MELLEMLDKRKEAAGAHGDDEAWCIDEPDEMESEAEVKDDEESEDEPKGR